MTNQVQNNNVDIRSTRQLLIVHLYVGLHISNHFADLMENSNLALC